MTGGLTQAIAAVDAEDVRIGSLRINIAYAPDSRAGVLLYPTIMGMDRHMRDFAKQFAAAGMTAVVWDPYNGEDAAGGPMDMLPKSKQCEDVAVLRDLRVIVDHMQDDLDIDAIAGVGWCFGGRIGLLHAGSDERIVALSAYNPTIYSPTPVEIPGVGSLSRDDFEGQTIDEYESAAAIDGPVQVCRPEHDLAQPPQYEQLIATLFSRPSPTLYEYYPAAHHGFSYSGGEANEWAHRVAWSATMSLFSTTLFDRGDRG